MHVLYIRYINPKIIIMPSKILSIIAAPTANVKKFARNWPELEDTIDAPVSCFKKDMKNEV